MTDTGNDARHRLVAAAEELFATRGLESVSMREINTAAGSRNASALQYHFGDRAGIIRAVLAKHTDSVEARRHALLDNYEAESQPGVRPLAGALVRPLASELQERGGTGYIQVLADLLNRPQPAIDAASLDDPSNSVFRWRQLVEPLLEPEAIRQHRRFVAVRFATTELARRARTIHRSDHQAFVSDLIDLVTGLLTAPVSEESRRLMHSVKEDSWDH